MFVALDGQAAGFVAVADAIRPEAPEAVAALQVRTASQPAVTMFSAVISAFAAALLRISCNS